jgi:hypothetical protein
VAAIALASVVLAGGCGSGGSGGSDGEPSDDAQQLTLTPHQYREIERMYRAQLPFGAQGTDQVAATRQAIRGCREMDRSDPLLAALVDSCEELIESLAGLTRQDCATVRQCTALMSATATVFDRLLAAVDESRPIVERVVASRACRDVLLSNEHVPALERASDVFKRVADAFKSGEPQRIAAVEDGLTGMTADLENVPSAREMLRRFQRDCRPTTA